MFKVGDRVVRKPDLTPAYRREWWTLQCKKAGIPEDSVVTVTSSDHWGEKDCTLGFKEIRGHGSAEGFQYAIPEDKNLEDYL